MLVSLTVGKVDAGVTVLLTPDKRLIEFPSILLPPDISSGSIVDITVGRNNDAETESDRTFRLLQDQIYGAFGAAEPAAPLLRCRSATQTSLVLEWDPIQLATADLISLALFRNGQKAGNIPRPANMHSTKISGLAVDTEYNFHLVLRTTAGTYASERVTARTHKMTDLSGISITMGKMPSAARQALKQAVQRIGAKVTDDGVRIDTTHFVTTDGRGQLWEKAVELNIPVVRPEWVEACEKSGRILGVTKYYLDAMHPDGPPTEDKPGGATAAAAPATPLKGPKDLPATPPSTDSNNNNDTNGGESSVAGKAKDAAATSPSPPPPPAIASVEDGDEEGEKDKSVAPDEQKVRLEDKSKENLALRPSADKEKDDEVRGGEGKRTTSGDTASFQDVDL